jgi:hypothetical protein
MTPAENLDAVPGELPHRCDAVGVETDSGKAYRREFVAASPPASCAASGHCSEN